MTTTDCPDACDCEDDDVQRFLKALEACPRPPSQNDIDDLVADFYSLDDNIVGGSLHIVLEDYNWERHHVEFCKDWARERGDVAGERFAELLLTLTDEQLRAWLGPSRDGSAEGP